MTDTLGAAATDSDSQSPEVAAQPLRFGVLTDGAPLAWWQQQVLESLQQTQGVLADTWLLCQRAGAGKPVTPFLPDEGSPTAPARAFELSFTRGGTMSERAAAFRAVQQRELHFILSFTSEEDARFLLSATRWGVWQFFFGDWVRFRGQSAGFWEIAADLPVASALLAQLQPEVDSVRVLKQGHVRAHSFLPGATLRSLRQRCVHWPRQVCLELLEGACDPLSGPVLRASSSPRDRRTLASRTEFAVRAGVRGLRDVVRLLLRHDQWNIGVIDAPIQSLLDGPVPEARWLCHPRRHEFFADPFGVVEAGRLVVLCEHMDYRTGVGSIVAFEEGDPAKVRPVEVGPAVHRSYPYLLRVGGRLFCIPETCATREVALYELEHFPDRWKRVATLVRDLPLIDATLFEYGERWWLAASLPVSRGANCELLLFHAPALEGPWRPHACNPVKVDVRSARPGGTPFLRDGQLYRPAQDCSTTYGRSIVINRVRHLSENAFDEEIVARIEPQRPYSTGLHTLAAAGNVTLIDGKRNLFVPQQSRDVLQFAYRKLLGRRNHL